MHGRDLFLEDNAIIASSPVRTFMRPIREQLFEVFLRLLTEGAEVSWRWAFG